MKGIIFDRGNRRGSTHNVVLYVSKTELDDVNELIQWVMVLEKGFFFSFSNF